jgi:hypothetical protein
MGTTWEECTDEQKLAELFRVCTRLGIMSRMKLEDACDDLQIRMFKQYLEQQEKEEL